ncbi:MAG: glycosyltransferase family 4 protein [Gaiellaceae bacterium]
MRLLLVSDHYPPFVGGAERQTRLLATRFAAAGYEVAVAVPWIKGLPEVEDDEGVAVHRIRQIRNVWPGLVRSDAVHHPPPYPDLVTAWKLRRLVRSFRPDVVHSHGWISYSVAAALIGSRVPLLLTTRDYGYFCATRTLLHGDAPCSGPSLRKCFSCAGRYYGRPKGWLAVVGVFLWRPLLRRKVSAVSNDSTFVARTMRDHFLRTTTGRRRIVDVVIPSFLDDDPEDESTTRGLLEQLPKEPFILFVGAFRYVKGLDALFAAYECLEAPPPLVLIGHFRPDGPRELPRYATVLTAWPHQAVMAAYERALFAVMPSRLPEPLGTVVHEAMSRGKPVIGTSHGGHPDMIIDGETGFLVPPGGVAALAAAMERLLRDPELRARMGEAARQRAHLFNASSVLPRFAELYADIAATAQ